MKHTIKEPELLLPHRVLTGDKPVTVMVLPDSHAEPHYIKDNLGQKILEPFDISNARYDVAGQMIIDMRPDIVVDLGDFAECEGFSSYNTIPEDHQVEMDYASARDARERITRPLRELQEKQRRNKHKPYRPTLIALGGNHDYQRIITWESFHPNHKGLYSKDPSDAKGQGWLYLPYRKPAEINDVFFCHNFPSGIMNRPISGMHPASKIIKDLGISAVAGHAHIWDYKSLPNSMAGQRMALVAGCYFEQWHEFAGQANYMYTRGITMLYNVKDGGFTHRLFSMDELRGYYGK